MAAIAARQGGGAPQQRLQVNIPNPRAATIPLAPQAQVAQNLDVANTESQIGSRNVQNVNTATNTGKTVVDTERAKFDLNGAIQARARGIIANDDATKTLQNQLLSVRAAKPLVHRRSTGAFGEFIGQPGKSEGESYDVADVPLLGNLIYGGTDRSALQTELPTIRAGEKFNMIELMKKRAQETGSTGTGLGATAIPEFQALGQVNFNLESLAGGPKVVTRQLNKAEEALLRRYAAASLPMDTVMGMVSLSKEDRRKILDAAYETAKKEYAAGFKPPQAAAAPQMDTKAAALAELRRRGVIK
jgi:hypothetical protein